MFLLKGQCTESILIELSVLRNEACSQRKEGISYLVPSHIVANKRVLAYHVWFWFCAPRGRAPSAVTTPWELPFVSVSQ